MGAEVGLSPEERVERVRMALAEAGYPVELFTDDLGTYPSSRIPPEAAWRAVATVAVSGRGNVATCWPCYDETGQPKCEHAPVDPLTSPWPPPPEVPR